MFRTIAAPPAVVAFDDPGTSRFAAQISGMFQQFYTVAAIGQNFVTGHLKEQIRRWI